MTVYLHLLSLLPPQVVEIHPHGKPHLIPRWSCLSYSQFHGYCCPGSLCCQGISSHGIYIVLVKYSSLGIRRVNPHSLSIRHHGLFPSCKWCCLKHELFTFMSYFSTLRLDKYIGLSYASILTNHAISFLQSYPVWSPFSAAADRTRQEQLARERLAARRNKVKATEEAVTEAAVPEDCTDVVQIQEALVKEIEMKHAAERDLMIQVTSANWIPLTLWGRVVIIDSYQWTRPSSDQIIACGLFATKLHYLKWCHLSVNRMRRNTFDFWSFQEKTCTSLEGIHMVWFTFGYTLECVLFPILCVFAVQHVSMHRVVIVHSRCWSLRVPLNS